MDKKSALNLKRFSLFPTLEEEEIPEFTINLKNFHQLMHMGPVMTKPVFWVSNKGSNKSP